ncbi:MAG: hypothetical protein P4L81_00180 [Candidatus Pacebacteria bacterium]|nr:hypothetical protein [Candidatus Paceibacterota bacterium]
MRRTKNQHFISQVEQRLNTCNPGARPANQRIYEFKIEDRDERILRLTNAKGNLIENNLSMLDLFSFDVDRDIRLNFEEAFGRYEAQIRANTKSILLAHATGSSEISAEVFNLFVAKLMNFIRNPYSIAKVLNTFGLVADHHPTDPVVYDAYVRILTGRKPHQEYLCNELGISDDQYKTWLRLMFMLLTPMADGFPNFLEASQRSLFEAKTHEVIVHVHKYDEHKCLLSDRGFSSPIDQNLHLSFDFNLTSSAFIRYVFLDYKTVLGGELPESIRRGLELGPKLVKVSYQSNDLPALDIFHRRVIEQSYKNVYCSGKTAYGATILPPL